MLLPFLVFSIVKLNFCLSQKNYSIVLLLLDHILTRENTGSYVITP